MPDHAYGIPGHELRTRKPAVFTLVAILPGGSHDFSRVNENKYPCRICLKVVGVGREGLFCSACYVCHGCGLSNTCEPQEARANIDCVNAFLKRQSSGSSHLGDRLKRPL